MVTKVKLRTLQSPLDTVVACILIRTSVVLGSGFVHLLELEKIGRSVLGVQNRFHKCSLGVVVHTICFTEFVSLVIRRGFK